MSALLKFFLKEIAPRHVRGLSAIKKLNKKYIRHIARLKGELPEDAIIDSLQLTKKEYNPAKESKYIINDLIGILEDYDKTGIKWKR